MTNAEIGIFIGKLLQWHEEGANISAIVDEDNDSFEIEIDDDDGVKTYQEFNLYQGRKVWGIYNEELSSNN